MKRIITPKIKDDYSQFELLPQTLFQSVQNLTIGDPPSSFEDLSSLLPRLIWSRYSEYRRTINDKYTYLYLFQDFVTAKTFDLAQVISLPLRTAKEWVMYGGGLTTDYARDHRLDNVNVTDKRTETITRTGTITDNGTGNQKLTGTDNTDTNSKEVYSGTQTTNDTHTESTTEGTDQHNTNVVNAAPSTPLTAADITNNTYASGYNNENRDENRTRENTATIKDNHADNSTREVTGGSMRTPDLTTTETNENTKSENSTDTHDYSDTRTESRQFNVDGRNSSLGQMLTALKDSFIYNIITDFIEQFKSFFIFEPEDYEEYSGDYV